MALLGAVAVVDGSLDATMWPDAPAPPTAVPWLLLAAFTVPLLWRRTRPLPVLAAIVVACGLAMWWGLDQPGLLSLLIAAYSAGLRARPSDLAVAGGGFLAGLAIGGGRWGVGEAADAYVPLLAMATIAALLGITVRAHRVSVARQADDREREGRLAASAERARIAREMHDIVAHNLAVMITLADGAVLSAERSPQRATDLMEKVSATGRQALGDMRRLVGLLRDGGDPSEPGVAPNRDPADTEAPARPSRPQPGLDDISLLIDDLRRAGMKVDVTRTGEPAVRAPSAGLAVYRIVQEALTNTMKHAGPHAEVHVRLALTATSADVEVVDDGAGTPAKPAPPGPPAGHGLTGMTERAAAYGGRVTAGPRSDATGWRVHAHLQLGPGGTP